MSKLRRTEILAGPLWIGCQYRASRGRDPDKRRAAKSQISSPAREAVNARTSWQKLMLLIACNFSPHDLVVTLTYRDQDLPKRPDEVNHRVDRFIRNLRAYRRERKEDIRYIKTTEGKHSGGRYHHHIIINATGADFDIIRQIWCKNGDNISFEQIGRNGYEAWARYLTKESREHARRYLGERTWSPSRNLRRPIVSHSYVSETDALSPPPVQSSLIRWSAEIVTENLRRLLHCFLPPILPLRNK